MNRYPLSIITPKGQIFSQEVTALTAPGFDGSLGVMAQHAPMMNALRPGILKVTAETTTSYFAIQSGVLEVHPDGSVLVLLDEAILADSLAAAQKQFKNFEHHHGT